MHLTEAIVLPVNNPLDFVPLRSEKNWAFHDWNNTLLIMIEVAPCVAYFRYVPAAFKGIEVKPSFQ